MDRALFRQLTENLETAPIDDSLRALLRYVEKLTRTPSRLQQNDYDDVLATGCSEDALADAIDVCAFFNLFNRLVDGHGIEASAGASRLAGVMLPRLGYVMPGVAKYLGPVFKRRMMRWLAG